MPQRQPDDEDTDMDRQQIGRAAEDTAVAFLESKGIDILMRNYRRRAGELDVVAREGNILIIAEVRTRSSAVFGGAAASVDSRKRMRLLRAAAQLLQQRKDLARLPVRFDIIVVRARSSANTQVEWIRHAFTA
jgi:putative endonuclease